VLVMLKPRKNSWPLMKFEAEPPGRVRVRLGQVKTLYHFSYPLTNF
jgi:hypothetical protein